MANTIKVLYRFSVPFSQEVDNVEVSKDENNNDVKTTRKVKKEISRSLCLKRPNRVEIDEALLYYSVQVHEGIKAGMVSKPILGKLYDNEGGILSRPEVDRQNDLWIEFYRKNGEYQRLYGKPNKTADEQGLIETLIKEMMDIRRRLQEFEMMQSSVYDITAESRARTRTIIWWLLNLAYYDANYEQNDGKTEEESNFDWQPLFPGKSKDPVKNLEERQAVRDEIEEGDKLNDDQKIFYFRAIQRAAAATAFWHYGRASTQKEFEALEHEFNVELLNDTTDTPPLVEDVDKEDKKAADAPVAKPRGRPKKEA